MNDYKWSVKARLSKEEQEGMASLLAKLREKREQATGVNESFTLLVQTELRDDEDVKNVAGVGYTHHGVL